MSATSHCTTYALGDARDDGDVLSIVKIMREIEGRRFAGQGRWRDQDVFFKIFTAVDRVERHVQREWDGFHALQERGIKTADIIHEAAVRGPDLPDGARCLLYRWIPDAENIDRLLGGVVSETRALSVLHQLAATIGAHHGSGLVQKDLHFGNFAVAEDSIYTFDVGSIEVKGVPVSKSHVIENLALFFAQMDPVFVNKTTMPSFVDAYMDARHDDRERPEVGRLWKRIIKERRRRMDRFLDKVLRPCRLVSVFRMTSGRKALLDRRFDDDALRELMEAIDQRESLVDGLVIPLKDTSCRVKVYGSSQGGLFRSQDNNPALRSWRAAQRLLLERVPVVRPLACVEGGAQGLSWILQQQAVGTSLQSVIAAGDADLEQTARSVAALLVRLDQLNLVHGRMSKRSFAVWNDEAYLTDLEDLQDGRERSIDHTLSTSSDMRELLSVWHGEDFGRILLGALNDHGYAFDL